MDFNWPGWSAMAFWAVRIDSNGGHPTKLISRYLYLVSILICYSRYEQDINRVLNILVSNTCGKC